MEDEGREGTALQDGDNSKIDFEQIMDVDPCLGTVIIASRTDHSCGLLLLLGERSPRHLGAATQIIRITTVPSLLVQVQSLDCLLNGCGEGDPVVLEVVVVNPLGVSKLLEEILLVRGEIVPGCVVERVGNETVPDRLVVLKFLRSNLLLVRETLPLPLVVGSDTFVKDDVAGAQIVLPGVAGVSELPGGFFLCI